MPPAPTPSAPAPRQRRGPSSRIPRAGMAPRSRSDRPSSPGAARTRRHAPSRGTARYRHSGSPRPVAANLTDRTRNSPRHRIRDRGRADGCRQGAAVRAAAAPLDQAGIVQLDVVRVQAGPPQELQNVARAQGAAEDLAVAADAPSALGVRRVDDHAQSGAHPSTVQVRALPWPSGQGLACTWNGWGPRLVRPAASSAPGSGSSSSRGRRVQVSPDLHPRPAAPEARSRGLGLTATRLSCRGSGQGRGTLTKWRVRPAALRPECVAKLPAAITRPVWPG